ncbi:SURF1 family protein, partial [Streptomyces sp. TRM76130]|nr:SURF1 family protein [Streptomyces sp. TRM76130]
MYRFLLTPRWWGINVFVVLAIPFCVFMGSWQLSRFEDRVDEHHSADRLAESARTQAARPLADLLPVD